MKAAFLLAVTIAMWPRGEVGAGVLIVSLSYGIGGPILTVALLSLALNISLTGLFILWVKRLLGNGGGAEASTSRDAPEKPTEVEYSNAGSR